MMDWLEDGGCKSGTVPSHVNQSSVIFTPRSPASNLSKGEKRTCRFEVDAHFSGRRWIDVRFVPEGTELLNAADPNGERRPINEAGTAVRWKILENVHEVRTWRDKVPVTEKPVGVGAKPFAFHRLQVGLNGTEQDLDFRHRFDWYISQNHFKIMEEGRVILDQDFSAPLPFSRGRFVIVHRVYHTRLDTRENYFSAISPHRDLRHWGPVRIEMLP